MPNKSFKATDGLLRDTMRKQSGVIEKALLEAIMNAVDAGATEVTIDIAENLVTVEDDGSGISEDEVEEFFEKFGNMKEQPEDKEFGKFQMGRGQIFNFGVNYWHSQDNIMVVSLDDESVTMELDNVADEDDESILESDGNEYTLDTHDLSYSWLNSDEYVDGTRIEIALYNRIEDVDATVSELRKLARYISWMHDTKVVINGDEVHEEPEVVRETDLAYYASHSTRFGSKSQVYNKGALVDDFDLGRVQLAIISKVDLDVTLDRTDVLDTDSNWQEIQNGYLDVAIDILKQKDEPSQREQRWLLEQIANDVSLLDELSNEPLMKDIHGNSWSIESIAEHNISFARKGDKVAEEAMRQSDTVIIREKYETELKNLVGTLQDIFSSNEIKEYSDVVETDMKWEMNHVADEDLSKRRSDNLDQIRQFLRDLGFTGDVNAGHSKHQDVWKDDEGAIFVDKDFINAKKQVLHTRVAFEVVRVAAYSGDTRGGMEDSVNWRRSFKEYMEGEEWDADCDFPTAQQRLMDGKYQ